MRALVVGLMAIVAVTSGAAARDCAGQGSERLLIFDDWAISSSGKSQVDLSYRFEDEKTATLLQGHVYFQIAPDDVLADRRSSWRMRLECRAAGSNPSRCPRPRRAGWPKPTMGR